MIGGMVALGGVRIAVAEPVAVAASGYLNVSAVSGFSFVPNMFEQLPVNSTITVEFTDGDTTGAAHTFTIVKWEGHQIPSSENSSALNQLAYGSAHGNLVNINASSAGPPISRTFTSPAAGWYEFVCTQSGHFQTGMYGFVAFGENLPSNLTVSGPSVGPGEAVFIIVGTIVTLTVIAIVLGFVVGRRRGASFEMPPERLGYAEPPAGGSAPNDPLPPRTP